MASDTAIDKMIFGGRIPVQFELSHAEPFYLLAPRCGYLTMCCEKLKKNFQSELPDGAEIWFQHNGIPLKWNYPIGVLYDSYGSNLPWRVSVQTSNYPDTKLMKCSGMSVVEAHYISQLKQANFIKHGTLQVEGLQSDLDRKQLWLGVINDDYEQFWRINKKLMSAKTSWYKKVPYRMYIVKDEAIDVVEHPFPALDDAGKTTTVDDLLKHLGLEDGVILVHGVSPPRDTPLQWLAEHLSYPDNIVHIVWKPKQDL
eukprot:m.87005 g.87005  ORF g.87005 m.87005 type:complete len:256 (-) comp13083_c1_seq1:231-998(-)